MPTLKLPTHYWVIISLLVLLTRSAWAGDTAKADSNVLRTFEAFSALPAYGTPALSPSGTKLAFVQNVSTPEDLAILSTYDLVEGKKHYLLRSDNEKVKIRWYKWVNDERLLVSARYQTRRGTTKVHDTRLLSMSLTLVEKGRLTLFVGTD